MLGFKLPRPIMNKRQNEKSPQVTQKAARDSATGVIVPELVIMRRKRERTIQLFQYKSRISGSGPSTIKVDINDSELSLVVLD